MRVSTKGKYSHELTDVVRAAAPLEVPVVAHDHLRDSSDGVKIVSMPEEIAHAVRVGIETGANAISHALEVGMTTCWPV